MTDAGTTIDGSGAGVAIHGTSEPEVHRLIRILGNSTTIRGISLDRARGSIGTTAAGITVSNVTGVLLEDLYVRVESQYATGIAVGGSSSVVVRNNTIVNQFVYASTGIYIGASSDVVVEGNNLRDGYRGCIAVIDSAGVAVRNNVAESCDPAIELAGCSGVLVEDNECSLSRPSDDGGHGVLISGSEGITLRRNNLHHNAGNSPDHQYNSSQWNRQQRGGG